MGRKTIITAIQEANWQANKRLAVINARMGRNKMTKRKKFKLKTEPQPPDDRMIRETDKEVWHNNYLDEPLSSFIAELREVLEKWPDARIESTLDHSGCYYESDRPSHRLIASVRRRDDSEYNKQYKAYIKKLETYKEWYVANKEQIEKELRLRELDEIEDRELRAQAFEKEAKRLRKLNPDGH